MCSPTRNIQQQLFGWLADPKRYYRGQVCVGEYYNVSKYKSLPACYMHAMAHDIPYYYRLGARQFHYMHVTTAHWGSKSLTNYQMARQLWDVGTDCEGFGPTTSRGVMAPPRSMRRYSASLEKMLCNIEALKGWSSGFVPVLNQGSKQLFPDSHFQYRREPGLKCDGPTLVEMVAHGRTCRTLLGEAMAMPLMDRIKARLAEDERVFTYAERAPALLPRVRAGVPTGLGGAEGGGPAALRSGPTRGGVAPPGPMVAGVGIRAR